MAKRDAATMLKAITAKEEPSPIDVEAIGEPVIDLTGHSDSDDSDVVVIHRDDSQRDDNASEHDSEYSYLADLWDQLGDVDADHDNEESGTDSTDTDSVHSSWPTGSSEDSPGPTPSVDSFLEGPWLPRRPRSPHSSATSAAPHDEPQVPPTAESTIHVTQPSAGNEHNPIDLESADESEAGPPPSDSSSRSNWARGGNGLHLCAFCANCHPTWCHSCGFPLRTRRDTPLGGWKHEDF